MSVKVAAYKKLHPSEEYACSALEVKEWSKGFADLRIEFGTHRNFQFDSRCNNRPKIQGNVVVSVSIDRQLKPALFLYPIPNSQYPEQVKKEFLAGILPDLKKWLTEQLAKHENEIIGQETVVIELNGGHFKMHRLRYL
jgi:hypothetical protein